jgi:hypothetical protein
MGVVVDWSEYSDPTELLMRLDVLLVENAELRAEIADLRADNTRLRSGPGPRASVNGAARIAALPAAPEAIGSRPTVIGGGLAPAESGLTPEAKVALVRTLFAGREDVYATRWVSARTGRSGWSPAEDNPFAKHKDDATRVFWPLTDQVIYRHLSRPQAGQREVHLGIYPLLAGDCCRFLACDFDGKDGSNWRADAHAYVTASHAAGVPAYAEVSRSGTGAHVWTFFTTPVAAVTARALGMALLRAAIDARHDLPLTSYDRLFPAQDVLPTNAKGNARFGNLIALPLHGPSRVRGATVFCDPDSWSPYPDQFAYLSAVRRITPTEVDAALERLGPVTAGPRATVASVGPKPRKKALGRAPATVEAQLSAVLAICTDRLPSPLLAALKHTASFHNPDFYRKRTNGFPLGTPHGWSAVSMPPIRAGSSCPVVCGMKRRNSFAPRVAC